MEYEWTHGTTCECMDCEKVFFNHNSTHMCSCRECYYRKPGMRGRQREREKVATVNFCERVGCETLGKSHIMGRLSFQTAEGRETKSMDLCPGCVGDLTDLLGSEPAGERPKSYKEAWKPADKKDKKLEDMSAEELGKLYLQKINSELKELE